MSFLPFVGLTIAILAGVPYLLQSCSKTAQGKPRAIALVAIAVAILFYLYVARGYWDDNPGIDTTYLFAFIFICALFSIVASTPTDK